MLVSPVRPVKPAPPNAPIGKQQIAVGSPLATTKTSLALTGSIKMAVHVKAVAMIVSWYVNLTLICRRLFWGRFPVANGVIMAGARALPN